MKKTMIICIICAFLMLINTINAQDMSYGTNNKAGHYLNVGDAKIYYEVYGSGRPLLLLHGGLYGSISEYKDYIPVLSRNFKVIAIATRGHGKSEIGAKPFSFKLMAEDAMAVLKIESNDSAIVVGFSDGGIAAYVMAAEYHNKIRKVVAIGGGLTLTPEFNNWIKAFTPERFEKDNADFIKERKKLMPEPDRWNEFLEKLKIMWAEPVWVSQEKAKNIKCPVLTIGGDKEDCEQFVKAYKSIPYSHLAIIPNSGHVETMVNPFVFEHITLPFVLK